MSLKLPDEERPKREGFFALTSRLNRLSKEQKKRESSDNDLAPDAKDYVAMIISAFFTIFLPTVLILVGLAVGVMAIFGVFG